MDKLKSRIVNYWTLRADSFGELRKREYKSELHEKWSKEINRYLPPKENMRILDLGTGTGFFAFLLAEEGHRVTGIDLTEAMIDEALKLKESMGSTAEFMVMDAEAPDFPPESFDVLVTRNLTWTLPHLRDAYDNWFDLLVPGGVLINIDADYGKALEEDDDTELIENHAHKGLPRVIVQENDMITMEVYSYQQERPQWDVELLMKSGFEQIVIDCGVWGRVYSKKDEFYNPVPIFTLVAYKGNQQSEEPYYV